MDIIPAIVITIKYKGSIDACDGPNKSPLTRRVTNKDPIRGIQRQKRFIFFDGLFKKYDKLKKGKN